MPSTAVQRQAVTDFRLRGGRKRLPREHSAQLCCAIPSPTFSQVAVDILPLPRNTRVGCPSQHWQHGPRKRHNLPSIFISCGKHKRRYPKRDDYVNSIEVWMARQINKAHYIVPCTLLSDILLYIVRSRNADMQTRKDCISRTRKMRGSV